MAKDDLSFYDLVGTFMECVDIQISNDTLFLGTLLWCSEAVSGAEVHCWHEWEKCEQFPHFSLPFRFTPLLKNDAKTLHKFRNVFISLRNDPHRASARRRILSTNYHNFHSVLQR